MLFISAGEHFEKGKRQNYLTQENIDKIVDTYQHRREEDRYSKRVSMKEIAEKRGYNLNISRYISTSEAETVVDLDEVHGRLEEIERNLKSATKKHKRGY